MKKILIYRGDGADPFSITSLILSLKQENIHRNYSIELVDSGRFDDTKWYKETQLVIFPGGRDIPYHEALKGTKNKHILDFVKDGGNYLGICAGGYYGSNQVEFEPGNALEVVGERELKFFPGKASGPALGLNQFRYNSQDGAKVTNLKLNESNTELAVYYNGGSAFLDAQNYDNVSVIATFNDLEYPLAAIVKCQIGKGLAILSGVHPEYSASFECTKKHIQGANFLALKEIENERKTLFRKTMDLVLT